MAVIAIDLDNTLVFGPHWFPGAQDAIRRFREEGHKVIIHSCNNLQWVQRLVNEAGLVVDDIWDERGKPLADLYIDDKGLKFEGDWADTTPKVLHLMKEMDNRKW